MSQKNKWDIVSDEEMEVRKEKEKIDQEISNLQDMLKHLQEEKYIEQRNNAKLDYIRKYQKIILPLLSHNRTSCSDENPCNGYDGLKYRCAKCYLIELINYDWCTPPNIDFSVELQ